MPSAGGVLADWGAEVVKVEPPTGDPMRGLVNAGVTSDGTSFPWEIWNRGKRSIALDLQQERARAIVLDLAAEADVFLTSYLPTTRAKLGLDIADVRRAPTDVSACGTGSAPGRRCDRAATTHRFWSAAAVASAHPTRLGRPVAMPSGAFCDSISALPGGVIAGALLLRQRTGEGRSSTSPCSARPCGPAIGIVGAAVMGPRTQDYTIVTPPRPP